MVSRVYNLVVPNEVFLKVPYTEVGGVIIILEEAIQTHKPGTNNMFIAYIAYNVVATSEVQYIYPR